MRRLLIFGFVALLVGATLSGTASASVLFSGTSLGDFDSVDGASGAVTEVSDPLGSGQTVFKFTVKNEDVYPKSPFSHPRADAVSSSVLDSGEEFWLRTKFLIPESFPGVESPPIGLFSIAGPPFEGTPAVELSLFEGDLTWQRNETYGYDIPMQVPIERGRWTHLLMHERLDEAGQGFVEMWVNGEKVSFFGAGGWNPNEEEETQHLVMATMDSSNDGGDNSARLMSSRELGMFETGTLYFGPLKIGEDRPDASELLFEGSRIDDFASNQSAPGAITEVNDPGGSGSKVLKMVVSNDDVYPITPTSGPRAQLSTPSTIYPGQEFWWHSRFYLPSSFPSYVPEWLLLMEGPYGYPFDGSPPLSIEVSGSTINWQRDDSYNWDIPWEMPLEKNRWIDVLIHAKFATEGWVELWVDGEKITFFEPGTWNPNEEEETQRLEMQTRDHTNDGGANSLYIQSYRAPDMFESVTVYHGPVKAAGDRQDVEW